MKQLIGQTLFISLVLFVMSGNPLTSVWVAYADNIITFLNFIVFIVMLFTVYATMYADEMFKKSPPKKLVSPLYYGWTATYYCIVVILFIMVGWFVSAFVWGVVGILSTGLMKTSNEVYIKNHPNDEGLIVSKSKLEEMADGD